MSKELSKDNIKKLLFEKYLAFGIPDEKLETFYNYAVSYSKEYDQMKKIFNKKVEKYIIDEIKNDNVDMQIKVIERYKSIITIAKQKYNLLSIKDINIIYEQAIEYLKYMYNQDETLSINIVNNLKYIISNNIINKTIDDKNVKLFDISFMEQYIKYFDETTAKYCDLFECSPEYFNKLIKGEERATKDNIDSLCIDFNVNNYDELVENIKNKIKDKKLEIMVSKVKKTNKKEEKQKKTYDLRFMNLYLIKNNVSKETFSKFINVDIASVDKILDGTYKVSEDKLKKLFELFNVKNYDELKIAVGKIIIAKNKKEENKNEVKIVKNVENNDPKRDLSLLKEYIKLFGYPKRNLIELLHCGDSALEKILNGELLVKDSLLWELYSEFHTKNYDEFKASINQKIENKKQENEKKSEIDFNKINKIELFKMLNIDLNKEKDKFILILLLGGINNKCYTEDEVSEMLNINKNYIADLHKKTLIKLTEENDTNKNLKLTK